MIAKDAPEISKDPPLSEITRFYSSYLVWLSNRVGTVVDPERVNLSNGRCWVPVRHKNGLGFFHPGFYHYL